MQVLVTAHVATYRPSGHERHCSAINNSECADASMANLKSSGINIRVLALGFLARGPPQPLRSSNAHDITRVAGLL
jgi:hypothetical protein